MSSGAIAEGMKRLGWKRRPHAIHELQAAAAVGQMGLVQVYEVVLPPSRHLHTAQVLLTHADLADRERYLNARSTLLTLLALRRHPGHQRERHGGPPTRSSSATTTRSARWSPTWSRPTRW